MSQELLKTPQERAEKATADLKKVGEPTLWHSLATGVGAGLARRNIEKKMAAVFAEIVHSGEYTPAELLAAAANTGMLRFEAYSDTGPQFTVHYPYQPYGVDIFMEQAESGEPDILKAFYVRIIQGGIATVSCISEGQVTLSGYKNSKLNEVGLVMNDWFIHWGEVRIGTGYNLFFKDAKDSVAVVGDDQS